jgi:hypothetical protein
VCSFLDGRGIGKSVIAQIISDFALDPARYLFVAPSSDTVPGKSAKDSWQRDLLAVELLI